MKYALPQWMSLIWQIVRRPSLLTAKPPHLQVFYPLRPSACTDVDTKLTPTERTFVAILPEKGRIEPLGRLLLDGWYEVGVGVHSGLYASVPRISCISVPLAPYTKERVTAVC